MEKKKTETRGRKSNKEILQKLVETGAINKREAYQLTPKKKPEKGKRIPNYMIDEVVKNAISSKPVNEQEQSWNEICQTHIIKVAKIKKPTLDNEYSMQRAINDYFSLVEEDKVKPSVSGLALALGVPRLTLIEWGSGQTRVQCAETIRQALQMLEMFDEMSLRDSTNSKSNPVAMMFLMKNNHGYADQQTIIHKGKELDLSEKEIKEKYADMEIIDAEIDEKEKQ